MAENDGVICTHCGTKVDSGIDYCPKCGAQVAVIPMKTTEEYYKENPPKQQSETLMWAKILLVLYGALAFLAGFMLAGFSDWYVNMFSAEQLTEIMNMYGVATKDALINMFTVVGIAATVSGILALISAVMCFRRRYNKAAVVICVIAALVNIIGVFFNGASVDISSIISLVVTVGVGFIVAYLIYKVRDEFED